MGLRRLRGRLYFRHRRVELPVADVLGDAAIEQERVLTHVADRLAEVRETNVAHVAAIDADRAVVDIIRIVARF